MDLVAKYRTLKRWSQERLAEEAKLSRATIQAVESGRRPLTNKIAEALGRARARRRTSQIDHVAWSASSVALRVSGSTV